MKRATFLLAALLLLSGCGKTAAVPETASEVSPTSAATSVPTEAPAPTEAPTPSLTPEPTPSPTPVPETVLSEIGESCSAGCLALLEKYREDDRIHHLLTVTADGGSHAVARFFEKVGGEYVWEQVFCSDALIGINGMGKTVEGDGKTPCGEFGIVSAFGICADPGTVFPYTVVTETTYCCDEPGEFYNQIIDTAVTGHDCTGEAMFYCSPDYHFGLVPDYNSGSIYPNGSGIFIHCKGPLPYTYGCVALDEGDILTLLTHADAGMRVLFE